MRRAVWCLLVMLLAAPPAAAQDSSIDIEALVTFFGDNTELSNPFRVGETLLGTFAQVFAEVQLGDRLALRAGVFGNQLFGSDRSFEQVRPVLALVVGGPQSRFVFGTLETSHHLDGTGPDRTGLHGMLPPMQRETLAFERPWEAGLQWMVNSPRIKQDWWVHWQRLNTSERRERFDVGLTNRFQLRPAMALRTDAHLVHQGGQLSSEGPVADSWAAAVGLEMGSRVGSFDRVSLEGFALASRFVPDRERLEESRTGFGTFVRVAAERSDWRLHGILWRASDFIKQEGDAHYHSLRRDGTQFRALRDYAEAGLARTFRLGQGSFVEASVRWHLVESHSEYSFRIITVARLRKTLP